MELKTIVIAKIVCLILIIALIGTIIFHAKFISADKCTVNFITQSNYGSYEDKVLEVKVMELYSSIKEDKCIIKWDKNIGYFYDG